MYVSVACTSVCSWKLEDGIRFPGARVRNSLKLPDINALNSAHSLTHWTCYTKPTICLAGRSTSCPTSDLCLIPKTHIMEGEKTTSSLLTSYKYAVACVSIHIYTNTHKSINIENKYYTIKEFKIQLNIITCCSSRGPGFGPNAYIRHLTTVCNSSIKRSCFLSWLPWTPRHTQQIHIETHLYMSTSKK